MSNVWVEKLIKKYDTYISNIEWHIKTNKPPEVEIKKLNSQIDHYSEMLNDLKSLLSEQPESDIEKAAEKYFPDEMYAGNVSGKVLRSLYKELSFEFKRQQDSSLDAIEDESVYTLSADEIDLIEHYRQAKECIKISKFGIAEERKEYCKKLLDDNIY